MSTCLAGANGWCVIIRLAHHTCARPAPDSGRGDRYIQNRSLVMWPFGWQQSYTTWTASIDKAATPGSVRPVGNLSVAVKLTNTGPVPGGRVLIVMVRERGVAMPIRANRWVGGFRAVRSVEPGATATVTMVIGPDAWQRFDVFTQQWVAVPGEYELELLDPCCPLACGSASGCPPCTCPGATRLFANFTVLNEVRG